MARCLLGRKCQDETSPPECEDPQQMRRFIFFFSESKPNPERKDCEGRISGFPNTKMQTEI